jgi:class 3 adenylate cyclase
MEDAFQDIFTKRWHSWLYVKSTGDGLMIISEATSYTGRNKKSPSTVRAEHAWAFAVACGELALKTRKSLKAERRMIGCGIAVGTLDRVFLLGQRDYLGPTVNEASKAQSDAKGNDLVVSRSFAQLLQRRGRDPRGARAPGNRVRLDARLLLRIGAQFTRGG